MLKVSGSGRATRQVIGNLCKRQKIERNTILFPSTSAKSCTCFGPAVVLDSTKNDLNSINKVKSRGFLTIGDSFQSASPNILLPHVCFANNGSPQNDSSNSKGSFDGKPDWIKLQFIVTRLTMTLPTFFHERVDLTFYRQDIEFYNNIMDSKVKGISQYQFHLAYLKFVAGFIWAEPQLKVLNITPVIEDGTVRARWRIQKLNHIEAFVICKILKRNPEEFYHWIDGYSTFYVDANGLVYKHVADKVMPDEERTVKKLSATQQVLNRLGLLPKPSQ